MDPGQSRPIVPKFVEVYIFYVYYYIYVDLVYETRLPFWSKIKITSVYTYRVERENENRCNGVGVPSSKPNSFYCRIVFLLLSFIFHSMRIRASIMVYVSFFYQNHSDKIQIIIIEPPFSAVTINDSSVNFFTLSKAKILISFNRKRIYRLAKIDVPNFNFIFSPKRKLPYRKNYLIERTKRFVLLFTGY